MVVTRAHVSAALAALAAEGDAFPGSRLIDTSLARPAAVVVPVIFAPEPRVLFILRGAKLKDHAGEVGFPGGKPEPGDADLRETALRELGEEVGLGPESVEWLGHLTPCPVITGRFLIHPFVAAIREDARPFVASPEIDRVLSLPLLPLITGERRFHAVAREYEGERFVAPHFRIEGGDVQGGLPGQGETSAVVLYGASAYIFHELLARLARELGVALAEAIIEDDPPWGDRYARA